MSVRDIEDEAGELLERAHAVLAGGRQRLGADAHRDGGVLPEEFSRATQRFVRAERASFAALSALAGKQLVTEISDESIRQDAEPPDRAA